MIPISRHFASSSGSTTDALPEARGPSHRQWNDHGDWVKRIICPMLVAATVQQFQVGGKSEQEPQRVGRVLFNPPFLGQPADDARVGRAYDSKPP
jgi:hypothetical protein